MKDKKSADENKSPNKKDRGKRTGSAGISVYDDAIGDAIAGYADRRGALYGLFRRVNMYRKPWLLLGGSPRGGKTSLAAKAGLAYEFVFDGRLASGDEAPRWLFSEKAVYIDPPGTLAAPDRWSEFCRALKRHKSLRRRTADGLLLVVDVYDFLAMDRARVNRLAAELRGQADTLMSISGYEIPLYFIFTKSDKIEGFCELFAGKSAAEKAPVIGALISDDDQKRQPAKAFSSSYGKIYDSIFDRCLLKMISTDDIDKNRPLCRLTSELLLADGKVSALLTEFFNRRGRAAPRLGGFFFTSSKMGETSESSGRILGDVIPGAKFRMREAGAGTLFHRIKKLSFHLLLMMVCAAFVFGIAGSGLRDALYMRGLKSELAALLEGEPSLENQYMALEKLRRSYNYLGGKLKSPGRLIFGTDKVRGKIRDAYITASGQVMVGPAAKYLEMSMLKQRQGGRGGELTTEEHLALYHSLKTYLLLTGGNQVKAGDTAPIIDILEQALKNSAGPRYGALQEKTVKSNINTVIKFAANGLYEERSDPKIVQATRQRLTAAPRAGAVYGAVMGKLHTQRRFVPVHRVAGGEEILRYGHNVNILYTREGWEQAVRPELESASKDPFKADWVIGPVKAQVDEAKFFSELASLYGDDLSRRWLDFIRNANVTLQPDMAPLAGDLEKLASRESEMRRMLAAVCSLATQGPEAAPQSKAGPVSTEALKGQIANVSNKLRGSSGGATHEAPDPFAEARKIFGAIDNFLTGGGFDDYQKALGELSEKIKKCDAGGGFTQVFTARDNDPLKICRDALAKPLLNMPPAALAPLKRLLEAPVDFTAGALAKKITAELEESWNSEVAGPFYDKLAGRYPLDKNGNDLAWGAFDEFFRPQGGALWRYYDKNLAGLMEKTHRGYEKRPARSLSIPLSINDELTNTCNRAERIASCFFKNDGMPKRQDITFNPFTSSGGSIEFFVGEKQLDFQGGLPVTVSRQHGSIGDETIAIRLTARGGAQGELRFKGEWGAARLINTGKIDRLDRDRYRVIWRVNAGNTHSASVTAIIQSNSEPLFDESVLRGFGVPRRVAGGK